MSDAEAPPPEGTPIILLVDGILDGRVRDEAALHAATERLGTCGAGAFRLEVTGGRFSMLPAETQVAPDDFDAAAQSNFLDALQAIADAALPGSIESTLRCKLVFEHDVAETLFVARGPQLEPLTRRRPRTADDGAALPGDADRGAPFGLDRRQLLWIAPVLFVLGGVVMWQSGWIDRILAARADSIATDTGPFAATLQLELTRSWGNYAITIRRGENYPTTPEQLQRLRDASTGLADRAAVDLVGNGGEIYVQLLDGDGDVVDETRTELRRLLDDAEGEVEVSLAGHMVAARVTLSLSSKQQAR